ncbi:MAG: hypothetical protein JXA42_05000 [Anaerolineales bacterium]|nr:hypothetical protein [Anaerolineales bacterium]
MGLMIHSLGELPATVERAYYIYLLDYGWHEPLAEAVYKNFCKMADMASRSNAVVMRGVVGWHFADEVLSWHHIDGQPAEDLLPAILITTRHPQDFHIQPYIQKETKENGDRLLIIPLRSACKTTSEVVELIEKLFRDIRDQKTLGDFLVAKELKKGTGGALVDALILQPNFAGVGLDLKSLGKFFMGLRQ